MANPAKFPEANLVLTPAPGTEDRVSSLQAHITRPADGGTPVITSCWKLTPEELAEINRTGVVWLHVYGETSFPVCVAGTYPFSPG